MLILIQYAFWFYAVAPLQIIKIARNYIIAVWHGFYIVNHLKTLFFPWHRQEVKLEPKTLADKILIATAGRIADFYFLLVAALVRITVIITGIVAEIFTIIIFSLFLIGWIFWPVIFIYVLISGALNIQTIEGAIYIAATFIITAVTLKIFYKSYYSNPRLLAIAAKPGEKDLFSYRAAKIVKNSQTLESLVKSLIKNKDLEFIFKRLNVETDYFEKILKNLGPGILINVDDIFKAASDIRKSHSYEEVTSEDIFIAVSGVDPFLKAFYEINIEPEDIDNLGRWGEAVRRETEKTSRFWDLENLLRAKPIGQTWVYGYTPFLDKFTNNILSQGQAIKSNILIGRQKEIGDIERILSKRGENNVILVGEPGVGKESIIKGFSFLVASGETLPNLDYKRVLQLNVQFLISAFKTIPDIQTGLIKLLNEAERAGNIILVVSDIHNFVGGGELSIGKVDITEILIPYLKSSRFQLIATTDFLNFNKYIEKRPDLMEVFSRIDIAEPSIDDIMMTVEMAVLIMEKETNIFFTFMSIKNIVYLADKYIHTTPFPEKALDLLGEAITFVQEQKRTVVTGEDIKQLISKVSKVPVGIGTEYEKKLLLNLEDVMHQNLINQEEAVKVIAQALRRLRAGLTGRHKPIGAFLFIGPTGVGKTETAKVLAKQYFGSDETIIRFDMSEYQELDSIGRFIGSIEKNEPGQFVSKVRDNPFSLILLDEIEKANRNILNLFLTVFDEGYINDVYGRKVNLEQTIIIATSNAGTELIRQMIQQNINPETKKDQFIDYLLKNNYFTPEFINRFDAVVIYEPLSEENLIKIAELMLTDLKKRLKNEGYIFEISEDIKKYIAKKGFDPQFGARPMRRVIQDKIEEPISKMILNGELKKGEAFTLPSNLLV